MFGMLLYPVANQNQLGKLVHLVVVVVDRCKCVHLEGLWFLLDSLYMYQLQMRRMC